MTNKNRVLGYSAFETQSCFKADRGENWQDRFTSRYSRRLTETVFDIWSYFQDGSHGVRPPLDVDVQDCPYEGEKHKVTK